MTATVHNLADYRVVDEEKWSPQRTVLFAFASGLSLWALFGASVVAIF